MTFDGKYAFLSNFYICGMQHGGRRWSTSEHAYQAAKATTEEDFLYVANSTTAGVAKRRGGELQEKGRCRADWKDVRVTIMYEILVAKFSHPELEQMLLSTGNIRLIEGNTWGDVFWGVDIRKRTGQNMLGRLLMQIRAEKQAFE